MAELAAAAAALGVAGVLGFGLRADDPLASPLTPAAGVAIGLLWVRGMRLWPAAAVGVGVAELVLGSPTWIAALDGLATAAEAAAGGALLALVLDRTRPFGRIREVLWFVGLAVVAAPLLGALIATGGRWLAGDPGVVGDWWLGDGVGVLIAAPLVIVWSTPLPHRDRRTLLGYAGLAAATAALAAMVFGDDTGRVTELYLLLPLAARRRAARPPPCRRGRHGRGQRDRRGGDIRRAAARWRPATCWTAWRRSTASWRRSRWPDWCCRRWKPAGGSPRPAAGACTTSSARCSRPRRSASLPAGLPTTSPTCCSPCAGTASWRGTGSGGATPPRRSISTNCCTSPTGPLSMSRGLLALGRPAPGPPAVVDLADVVRDAARVLPPLVGDRVAIRASVPDEPVVVEAHRTQLERVVINLAVNGGDAMPDGGPLEIAVGTTVDAATGAPEAVLTVTDAGLGMDGGTSDRVFDPYFTTKGDGGTGLGLANVQRIVGQLGGRVSVRSHPGEGSSFSVHLPEAA